MGKEFLFSCMENWFTWGLSPIFICLGALPFAFLYTKHFLEKEQILPSPKMTWVRGREITDDKIAFPISLLIPYRNMEQSCLGKICFCKNLALRT